MKKVLLLLLFLPLLLSAQIDESDTLKIKAGLSLTGFWQRGNVQTSIFRGRTDFSVRPWKKWVYKNTNSYVYQAFGKEKADEDILSLNFLYFNPQRKVYPLALAFMSTNFRRAIDSRYLIGAGATFQVLRKEEKRLKFSLTFEYEATAFDQTNFNQPEFNGKRNINTVRGTLWINGKYHLFDKKLILSHESYYQPSLEDRENYRWRAEVGLEVPLWKFLNFTINYIDTFESIVIENQVQGDQFLTFGVKLKSY
ncbi:MAG: DUF481 domain-containing protein [Ekhidna sp.]